MKKVICDHAGESEYCDLRWCNHCVPHDPFWPCVHEECGFLKKEVRCVEAPDDNG